MQRLIDKIRRILLYSGLDKEEFEAVSAEFYRLNTSNVRIFAVITLLYTTGMYISSFGNQISMLNRYSYLVMDIIAIVVLALSYLRLFNNRKAIYILVYLLTIFLFLFGIELGLSQPDQISATFLVLMMAVPLLFYDKPIRFGALIIIANIIFVICSLKFKAYGPAETDLVNGIVLGSLSFVINTRNLMVRTERVAFGLKMQLIAELDALTNLHNRNCFESRLRDYAKTANKSVTCIFADVNGLHDYNNRMGHEAGDEMLKFIAKAMTDEFGTEDAYRIGGDEYVVMLCDQIVQDTEARIQKVIKIVEDEGFHISVGISCKAVEGIDMEHLVKSADAKMYAAKKEYYMTTGKDRRKF